MSVLRDFFSNYLSPALQEALSEMLGGLIGWMLVLLVLLPVFYIAYRLLKKSGVSFNVNLGGPVAGGGASGIVVEQGQPQVYRLGNSDVQMAQDLVKQGQDLDAVCRRVNADYAGWEPFRQQAFRSMMGEVLKSS
jgi:hypothetical protein